MTNNFEGWKHIASAPKDKRIIVWTGQERYCAHWVKNPFTGDEAWCVSEDPDGMQHIVYPSHWRGCPNPPSDAMPDDDIYDNEEMK